MKRGFMLIFLMILTGCAGVPSYRFNYFENRHEIARPNDVMKYNHMSKEYSFEPPESQLRFNFHEKRFEFTE